MPVPVPVLDTLRGSTACLAHTICSCNEFRPAFLQAHTNVHVLHCFRVPGLLVAMVARQQLGRMPLCSAGTMATIAANVQKAVKIWHVTSKIKLQQLVL